MRPGHGEGEVGACDEIALRTERIHPLHLPRGERVRLAHRRAHGRTRVRRSAVDRLTVYEGMLKEEMDPATAHHSEVDYEPVLLEAAYAGLIGGADSGSLGTSR